MLKCNEAYVHSIETFGTVDGPGTRFVLFLKGCNMRCLYCHNPDTFKIEGAQIMSVDEILSKYDKVKHYMNGGITVTGGEPLLQLDFLISFFKECKIRNIHTVLDTSGSLFNLNSERIYKKNLELIKYVDLVLLDIKHIDPIEYTKLTSRKLKPTLDYARFLSDNNIAVWIRHVVIKDITLVDSYLYNLGEFISTLNNVDGIEVLPYHTLGLSKYEMMKMDYPLIGVEPCSKSDAIRAKKIILYAINQSQK